MNSLSHSEDPAVFEMGDNLMMDTIYTLLVTAFFWVCILYIHFCERI